MMIFRKAQIEDANKIAQLSLLAMEDIIFEFIGRHSKPEAIQFLTTHIQQLGNQYSYDHCWVAVINNEIVGTAIVYDGADLHQLRAPIKKYILQHYQKDFNPENETQAGEIYIDSVGVDPLHQGKGIGAFIFHSLIKEYVGLQKKTLGLLVDIDNPKAKKLYLKLGFKEQGKKTLAGKQLEHLQYLPTYSV